MILLNFHVSVMNFDGHKRVRRGKTKGRVGQLGGDRMIDNLPNLDNPCAIHWQPLSSL